MTLVDTKVEVVLHGFVKKTRRTPIRDIEIAERRLNDFLNRQGG